MAFKLPNKNIKSAISTTGYKSNSPDVDNDVNIIPSNKIISLNTNLYSSYFLFNLIYYFLIIIY